MTVGSEVGILITRDSGRHGLSGPFKDKAPLGPYLELYALLCTAYQKYSHFLSQKQVFLFILSTSKTQKFNTKFKNSNALIIDKSIYL